MGFFRFRRGACWILVLSLAGCAGPAAQVQQAPADGAGAARQAILLAIAKACTQKYGDRTPDTLSCILKSTDRFDRGDRSLVMGPFVTCMQMGSTIACN